MVREFTFENKKYVVVGPANVPQKWTLNIINDVDNHKIVNRIKQIIGGLKIWKR